MRRLLTALTVLVLATSSLADGFSYETDSVVFLTKNTNANQVHYGVRVDESCRPVRRRPVQVYWRMLEKGPDETAGLMIWERPGYGVRQPRDIRHGTDSGSFDFVIRGVAKRKLTMETFATDDGCRARVTTVIAGQQAVFERIDIEVSGWANVHRVEIFGLDIASGDAVSEVIRQQSKALE